jgi:hypothetical protein
LVESTELGMTAPSLAAQRFWDDLAQLGAHARSLPDYVRDALGRHFAHSAQMEHASIASFNRFSMQLLGLGAPAELVELAQRAALDEVHHARICFAIASEYLGQPLGPAPLDLSGNLLEERELDAVVAGTIVEGCVGETLAAVEAGASRDLARVPALRSAWALIAEDEASHAELAWSFVSWAIDQGGTAVRERARSSFAAALRDVEQAPVLSVASEPALEALGVLGANARHELRRSTVTDTLRPAAARLCG